MSENLSFQTVFYRGVAIHMTFGGKKDSYCVTMSHGTRAFCSLAYTKKYIRHQQKGERKEVSA